MTNDESAALIEYYEQAEKILFGWIMPIAFMVGAVWMVGHIESIGEWDRFVVYGIAIGGAGFTGSIMMGSQLAEVVNRVR